LYILDAHFAAAWKATRDTHQRELPRRKGLANYRLVRYADDWLLMVAGTQADAESLREEAATVLLPMGLRLSEEKTRIVHIDQGFDLLGMHIQRHKQRGSIKHFVYTYPSRAALAAVKAKVRDATCRSTTKSSPPCCTDSTLCCVGGRTTTVMGLRPKPSPTSRLHLAAGVVLAVP
jgi:RNA-directed DNA polymerase